MYSFQGEVPDAYKTHEKAEPDAVNEIPGNYGDHRI